MTEERFYESPLTGACRSAPAALRNRAPIAEVLREWLPKRGLVLEIASGTGEHVVYFAEKFQELEWQPSDIHPDALVSIGEWIDRTGLKNVRQPLSLDASSGDWPICPAGATARGEPARTAGEKDFSAVLCINMVHIAPWSASLGLLNASAKVLKKGGALILYGPWLKSDIPAAPSNLAFDEQLRERNPEWGLRSVEDFEAEAKKRGFVLEQICTMPANNLMLLFRFGGERSAGQMHL